MMDIEWLIEKQCSPTQFITYNSYEIQRGNPNMLFICKNYKNTNCNSAQETKLLLGKTSRQILTFIHLKIFLLHIRYVQVILF